MTERQFGQALLEGDVVNPAFFYMLAKENKKELRSCVVQIPPTILFEQGFTKAVFATESIRGQTGEVKNKISRDVDLDDVFEIMTKGVSDRAGSLCAVLLYAPQGSSELTAVKFLDKDDVKHFIYHEIEKPKSLMQRFVVPKGNNNTLIHATWSPLLMVAEGKRCSHSLNDSHLNVNRRGQTFEDPNSDSVDVNVSKSVIREITDACNIVAQHFEKTERLLLNRMSAYFKVDANSKLYLLYSTCLRFENTVTHCNGSPVSLGLGVRISDDTQKHIAKVGGILKGHDPLEVMDMALKDADERNKHMLITVPSIPDNTTLILKSLHGKKFVSPTRRVADSGKRSSVTSPVSPFPSVSASNPASPAPLPASSPFSDMASIADLAKVRQRQASLVSYAPPGAAAAKGPTHDDLLTPGMNGEAKYLTLSEGAVLPQPKALMHAQHILPNSSINMKTAMSTISETQIQEEWSRFLQLQSLDIQKIRISDAQRAAELAKEAVKDVRNHDRADSGVTPAVKLRTHYDLRQPDKKRDSPTGENLSKPGTSLSDGRRSKLSQVPTILEVDPAMEQLEFMNNVRHEIAKKSIEDKELSDQQREQDAEELEDDPRFVYMSRDSKPRHLPKEFAPTKSTLLPPMFRGADNAAGRGNVSPTVKQGKAAADVSKSKERPFDAPPAASFNATLAAPKKLHHTASPSHSHHSAPSEPASPLSRKTSMIGSFGLNDKEAKLQANAARRSQVAAAAAVKRSASLARVHEILEVNRSEEIRARAKRDYVAEMTESRCRSQKEFTDLAGLPDTDIDIIEGMTKQLCLLFQQFMQDLLYTMHEIFLIGADSMYVEIPIEFQSCISVQTLSHILHKLHGKIVPKITYLTEQCPPTSDIVSYRAQLLKAQREFLLRGYTYDDVTSVEQMAPGAQGCCDTDPLVQESRCKCLIFRLFPSFGLNIVREESFAVFSEVEPFIDRDNNGVVYFNALKTCYYQHLVNTKGANAVEAMKRQTMQQEQAELRAVSSNASNTRCFDFEVTGEAQRKLSTPSSPIATPLDAAELPVKPKTPMQNAMRKVSAGLKMAAMLSSMAQSANACEEIPVVKNDIVCPRCNTCKVLCVCHVVYGVKSKKALK